jgi:hypothetical protein
LYLCCSKRRIAHRCIVQKKSEQDPAEQRRLELEVETALSEAMDERGWARGSARAKVAKS